jgi:uncharacterized protein
MHVLEYIKQPWPWYVAGPLIGLTVPALLLINNKVLGVSSSLRHICAAVLPAGISFFKYDWKKEMWNLFFVAGVLAGGFVAVTFLKNPVALAINPKLVSEYSVYGVHDQNGFVPGDLFNWAALHTLKGWILIVAGGLLVGFGTRYAGGCTSGHSIMGLSNLQWPSLIATICFMAGGFIMVNLILPLILQL